MIRAWQQGSRSPYAYVRSVRLFKHGISIGWWMLELSFCCSTHCNARSSIYVHTRRCSMHIIKLDIISYIGGTVLDDGRMGKRGRSRRFALLSARRGASLLSYSQLFRKLLMPMKTLADWRERRNDVHSVGLRARTWVGGRDVYVDLSMCYSYRRESWSSCPSSPLGTSLSRMKQSAASLGWSLSRLSRGTLCLSGTVMF